MKRLFATQFPIEPTVKIDELLALERKWISGSPHTNLESKNLEALAKNGDCVKSKDENELVTLDIAEADSYSAVGLTYKTIHPLGDFYQSTIVGSKSKNNFWVSIAVDFYSHSPKSEFIPQRKPHLIKQIFEEIGGGMDGDIPVSDEPFYLKDGDETFVAEILNGKTRSIMPVVYLSRNRNDFCSLDPTIFSRKLSGLANIIVEPAGKGSKDFSFRLRDLINDKNVFNGTIGLYFPNGLRDRFWLPRDVISNETPDEISEYIIDSLIPRSMRKTLTLENIKEINNLKRQAELKTKIDELASKKDKKPSESEEYLKQYIEAQTQEIENLTKEKLQLEREKEVLESSSKASSRITYGGGIVRDPKIGELYSGEVRQIVLETLETVSRGLPDMNRRKVILEKIAATNPNDSAVKVQAMKEEIKLLFNDYKHLTHPIRKGLEKMGFIISEEGGHYKVYAEGDEGGVCYTLPKSGSDVRGGKNATSDFIKTFFK